MNKIFIFIIMVAAQTVFSQESNNVSIFHRLLIYNSDQEVMIVQFKDTDIWVTPGFYQDSVQFIQEGLHKVAAEYGIRVTDPELKGVFSMRREFTDRTEMSVRNIYRSDYIDGTLKIPEFLGDVKWVSVDEALQSISYKSIILFLKQTNDYPDAVWGGSVNIIRKDNKREYQVMEEFYPLFERKKAENK